MGGLVSVDNKHQYEKELSMLEKNRKAISELENAATNLGLGYSSEDARKRYYDKFLTNYFFTGKDEEPSIDEAANVNNTQFFTKSEMNNFFTGKKDGTITPGPYLTTSSSKYYTKTEANDNFMKKSELAGYFTKDESNDMFESNIEKTENMVIKKLGHNDCHFNVLGHDLRAISGTNKWCSDLGSFILETNKKTKTRRFFGYITHKGYLDMISGPNSNKKFIELEFIFRQKVFNDSKSLSATVSSVGKHESNRLNKLFVKKLDGSKIIIGNLSILKDSLVMLMVNVIGFSP